jgi:hypothetical protein
MGVIEGLIDDYLLGHTLLYELLLPSGNVDSLAGQYKVLTALRAIESNSFQISLALEMGVIHDSSSRADMESICRQAIEKSIRDELSKLQTPVKKINSLLKALWTVEQGGACSVAVDTLQRETFELAKVEGFHVVYKKTRAGKYIQSPYDVYIRFIKYILDI